MKKLTIVLGVSILMMSCGGEDPKVKVCECSKLYDDMYAEAEKLESEGVGGMDAIKEARENVKEAYEACDKFHKELGDEEFATISKDCK